MFFSFCYVELTESFEDTQALAYSLPTLSLEPPSFEDLGSPDCLRGMDWCTTRRVCSLRAFLFTRIGRLGRSCAFHSTACLLFLEGQANVGCVLPGNCVQAHVGLALIYRPVDQIEQEAHVLDCVHRSRRSAGLTHPSIKGQRRAFWMSSRPAQWKSYRCAEGARQV